MEIERKCTDDEGGLKANLMAEPALADKKSAYGTLIIKAHALDGSSSTRSPFLTRY